MTNDRKVTSTESVYVGDSVNGLINMRPGQPGFGKSFNGIANMAPTSPQNTGQAQNPQNQPAQTGPASAPAGASADSTKK